MRKNHFGEKHGKNVSDTHGQKIDVYHAQHTQTKDVKAGEARPGRSPANLTSWEDFAKKPPRRGGEGAPPGTPPPTTELAYGG